MQDRPTRRRWADVAAILVAIYVFVLGFYSPGFAAPRAAGWSDAVGGLWGLTAISAGLALAAVIVSQRWIVPGRLLLAAAGVVLLLALTLLEGLGWYALVGVLLPGTVMLAAAPFIGPMPAPEEEGRERLSPGEESGAGG